MQCGQWRHGGRIDLWIGGSQEFRVGLLLPLRECGSYALRRGVGCQVGESDWPEYGGKGNRYGGLRHIRSGCVDRRVHRVKGIIAEYPFLYQ